MSKLLPLDSTASNDEDFLEFLGKDDDEDMGSTLRKSSGSSKHSHRHKHHTTSEQSKPSGEGAKLPAGDDAEAFPAARKPKPSTSSGVLLKKKGGRKPLIGVFRLMSSFLWCTCAFTGVSGLGSDTISALDEFLKADIADDSATTSGRLGQKLAEPSADGQSQDRRNGRDEPEKRATPVPRTSSRSDESGGEPSKTALSLSRQDQAIANVGPPPPQTRTGPLVALGVAANLVSYLHDDGDVPPKAPSAAAAPAPPSSSPVQDKSDEFPSLSPGRRDASAASGPPSGSTNPTGNRTALPPTATDLSAPVVRTPGAATASPAGTPRSIVFPSLLNGASGAPAARGGLLSGMTKGSAADAAKGLPPSSSSTSITSSGATSRSTSTLTTNAPASASVSASISAIGGSMTAKAAGSTASQGAPPVVASGLSGQPGGAGAAGASSQPLLPAPAPSVSPTVSLSSVPKSTTLPATATPRPAHTAPSPAPASASAPAQGGSIAAGVPAASASATDLVRDPHADDGDSILGELVCSLDASPTWRAHSSCVRGGTSHARLSLPLLPERPRR